MPHRGPGDCSDAASSPSRKAISHATTDLSAKRLRDEGERRPNRTVVDFLFDDASWKVRWLVVDCGTWLKRRKVLIHPSVVAYVNSLDQQFEVNLTKARVQDSPEWGEHEPVSQRMQHRLYDYHGWDPLWGGPYLGAAVDGMASPLAPTPYLGFQTGAAPSFDIDESEIGEPHLRSVTEVIGYQIHALDGDIGHARI